MKHIMKLAAIFLFISMFLVGCDKIKEMAGLDHDDAKSVEDCKTLELGMNTSDMLEIMGKPVSKDRGMGENSDLMNYIFTSSHSVAYAVIVRVDVNTDEVTMIQCEEGYNLGGI